MEHLIEQIAEIERQLSDDTLPHSDQQLLGQMWDELNEQLEAMELAEDDDDMSIHTQPKRLGTPLPLHPSLLIDVGNGCYITPEEFDRLHIVMFVDDEEGLYAPADEI
jgi:hypothetical protein